VVIRMPSPMKHSKTGVYWYRKVVPAHLRASVGKREIKRSLGTKDFREAKRLYPAAAEEAERELAIAEGRLRPIRLTLQQIVALSGEWYRATLAEQERDPYPADEYDSLLEFASDAGESGRVVEFIKRHVDVGALVAAKGLVVDTGSMRELCNRLFWDAVQLWNTLKRRAEGDYSPDPHLATLPEWELPKAGPAAAGPTFDELIEGWALDKGTVASLRVGGPPLAQPPRSWWRG
jgi:hypothetical protein